MSASARARSAAGRISIAFVAVASCAGCAPDLSAQAEREPSQGRDRTRAGRPLRSQNAAVRQLIGAASAAEAAPVGHGLTGAGVQVGVWDDGRARESHVELRGRVRARDLGGLSAHATHTTATLAGSGEGDAAARGIAGRAFVWAHDWLLDTIEIEAAAADLSVSCNAYAPALGWSRADACPDRPMWWGGAGAREDPALGRYGHEAANADVLVHRTDLPMVWPAGNERLDAGASSGHYHAGSCDELWSDAHLSERTLQFGTLGGAAVAKNVLTVGAARALPRAALRPERIVPMDLSSFGPTDDGRIKPDLLAGGDAVRSASAESDDAYAVLAGTSSATAATAGAIALLVELYRDTHGGADPRAAELKALLVHTARDAGVHPGPDYGAGYGLLDASAAAQLIAEDGELAEGERRLFVTVVQDGAPLAFTTAAAVPASTPLRVTLAWIDPPAQAHAVQGEPESMLVNDLDLVVTAETGGGRTRFHPWSLDARDPLAPASRVAGNHADNVEVVDVATDDAERRRFRIALASSSGLWRGRPQELALVSSVPLVSAAGSVLPPAAALPRYVVLESPRDEPPEPARVAIANRGGGALGFRASSHTPWLAVRPEAGQAPAELMLEVDLGSLDPAGAGEAFGRVHIESDDPSGPRELGVIWRAACEPQCERRRCGLDPRCGASCGRCAHGEVCRDGDCGPWNDACPHADLGSELGAALAGGDAREVDGSKAGSCGGDSANDASFAWTAPEAGRYAFTTRGSDRDTVLYVREGDCDGPELACNDDSGSVSSALALELAAGAQVTAVVDAFDERSAGAFLLNVERAACPSAQLGARVGPSLARASTAGGIDELSGSCGGDGSEDVALSWTAPAAGRYRFALFDPRFQVVLYLRRGGCDGPELGCSAAADVGPIEVELDAGEQVVVVVDGREGQSGDFTLDVLALDGSCAGACDGPAPGGACFCDAACVAAGDCCADACASCGQCRCQPGCAGVDCGDDGCGGSCGQCAAGAACEDGECVEDRCAGVECDACSACVDGRCAPLPDGAACEDGDPCTVLDRCSEGGCGGEERVCDDGFECTRDRCDGRSGACVFGPLPGCCERGACSDGGCGPGDPRCPADASDGGAELGDGGDEPAIGGDADDGCGCRVPGATAARVRPGGAALTWLLLFAALGQRLVRRRH
jgi:hypothetical protein